MKRTLIFSLLLIFSATLISQESLVRGKAKDQMIVWDAIVEMDNMIFPSYIYGTAMVKYNEINNTDDGNPYYYGDNNGQIGISVRSFNEPVEAKIVIEESNLFKESTLEFDMNDVGQTYEVFPVIKYDYEKLLTIKQPKPMLITYKLYINDELYGEKSKNVMVRSINECPFLFTHRSGTIMDQNWLFSSYVNENDPAISNQVIPKVTETGIVDQTLGYLGDNVDVLKQVFAVWTVLQNQGLHYSTITGFSHSQMVTYQFVRSVNESLNTAQANCVDGSVLMASVIYRMGLKPMLVLTPGHCYLGFYLKNTIGENNISFLFVETTMLGEKDITEADIHPEYLSVMKDLIPADIQQKHQASFLSFTKAVETATEDFFSNERNFLTDNADYQIINVDKWRTMGVSSIAF